MELVNRNVSGRKPDIGRIDLTADATYFDVRKEDARRVLDALRHTDFFGDKIRASRADGAKGRKKSAEGAETKAGKEKKERRNSRAADEYERAMGRKPKKEKKSKKEKKEKKAKYNGNFDMFIKKK